MVSYLRFEVTNKLTSYVSLIPLTKITGYALVSMCTVLALHSRAH